MITILSLLLTGAWCAVAFYQIWQDWHYRLLPLIPSFLGLGIGIVWTLIHGTWVTENWWIDRGLVAIIAAIVLGFPWWHGKLGLGDVVSILVFCLVFGFLPTLVILMGGAVLTIIGLLIRRIIKGLWNWSDVAPWGPGLWIMAMLMWIVLMVVMPMV